MGAIMVVSDDNGSEIGFLVYISVEAVWWEVGMESFCLRNEVAFGLMAWREVNKGLSGSRKGKEEG